MIPAAEVAMSPDQITSNNFLRILSIYQEPTQIWKHYIFLSDNSGKSITKVNANTYIPNNTWSQAIQSSYL